jgi:hypothetical protein
LSFCRLPVCPAVGPGWARHAWHAWALRCLACIGGCPPCCSHPARARAAAAGAFNDWNKDRQFQKLNAQKDIIEVKVVRGGQQLTIPNHEVVVGDVMLLDTGDKIVADGHTIETHGMVVDEASLTGESDPVKKGQEFDPWVRSGTQVGAHTLSPGRCPLGQA